jgi:hypothetical protein
MKGGVRFDTPALAGEKPKIDNRLIQQSVKESTESWQNNISRRFPAAAQE